MRFLPPIQTMYRPLGCPYPPPITPHARGGCRRWPCRARRSPMAIGDFMTLYPCYRGHTGTVRTTEPPYARAALPTWCRVSILAPMSRGGGAGGGAGDEKNERGAASAKKTTSSGTWCRQTPLRQRTCGSWSLVHKPPARGMANSETSRNVPGTYQPPTDAVRHSHKPLRPKTSNDMCIAGARRENPRHFGVRPVQRPDRATTMTDQRQRATAIPPWYLEIS